MIGRSQITVIDSTLREGRQADEPYLIDEDQAIDYLGCVLREGLVDRFELFTPGPHMSDNLFQALIKKYPAEAQLYCGPMESFSINRYPCLRLAPESLLSLTLVHGTPDPDRRLRQVVSAAKGKRLRIGIECAGEYPRDALINLIRRIDAYEPVRNIVISDSNGCLKPSMVVDLSERLPATRAVIGFHFHDDRGFAKDNLTVLSRSQVFSRGIEIDCALGGSGERNGITDLLDVLRYFQSPDMVLRSRRLLAPFRRRKKRLRSTGRPSAATSHYAGGKLRQEYQRLRR